MKRKQSPSSSEDDPLQSQELTPRKRRASAATNKSPQPSTPSTRLRNRARAGLANPPIASPTPKPISKAVFSTPKTTRFAKDTSNTPSRIKNADRSAKRKSVGILLNPNEDDVWDGGEKLAREIWNIDEEDGDEDEADNDMANCTGELLDDAEKNSKTQTPSKKGRQTGSRTNRRSPTPDGDLPSHERYFFQNRPGPVLTSDNTLSKLSLLTHEEYFELIEKQDDPYAGDKRALLKIHEHSFPQWNFELSEGFNVCLYGYGSKRNLLQNFADWLYEYYSESLAIVVVNGYTANITLKSIVSTIIAALTGSESTLKLGVQPGEALDSLQSYLRENPPNRPVTVLINSIDAPSLRRQASQAFLARLADIPFINVVATADTPNFLLLWDIELRNQFNFAFHDSTTFAPYDVEINVVDEVHNLLGRKVRRVGGKQGIGFVLKSLPANTRKLYRLLITELLTMAGDQCVQEDEGDRDETAQGDKPGNDSKEPAIEWRTLFHKATEEFISSSELMFRTQLKEFYDHQMVVSRVDASGTENLGVPLSQEEMESVLEDLVIEE